MSKNIFTNVESIKIPAADKQQLKQEAEALNRQINLLSTLAETILSQSPPENVCPSCIDTIIKITNQKLKERNL